MPSLLRLSLVLTGAVALLGACSPSSGPVLERRTTRTFAVPNGSLVRTAIRGGSITVETGPPGEVHVSVLETVYSGSSRDAEELLERAGVSITQERGELVIQSTASDNWGESWRRGNISTSATLTVPADLKLDLDTSGGSIRVRGDRLGAVTADTGGGSIGMDGGDAPISLGTSGGSITVGRVTRTLKASTGGGGITVRYIAPTVREVALDTSGGSITVGIDPDAKLSITARTSGGTVSAGGLRLEQASDGEHKDADDRSSLVGTLNGGGGSLRAMTSGGNIRLSPATPSLAR